MIVARNHRDVTSLNFTPSERIKITPANVIKTACRVRAFTSRRLALFTKLGLTLERRYVSERNTNGRVVAPRAPVTFFRRDKAYEVVLTINFIF